MAEVHLVRHTAVARHWSGRCYGRSDVPLSREGREAAKHLATRIAGFGVPRLYVSPLRRARYLAGLVSRAEQGIEIVLDARLQECHFGGWEGSTWDAIYAESGEAMMGLLYAPGTFRPGGDGETTYLMRDRVLHWLDDALHDGAPIVAICHGGPIAAIRGTISGAPVDRWPSLVPAYGEVVTLDVPAGWRAYAVQNP
jgi:broad specificity phosphatase PhoE